MLAQPIAGLAYHQFGPVHILAIVRIRVVSVDFRLGDRPEWRKEVEIATFVGLADMFRVERTVASRIARFRRFPGGTTASEFLFSNM
jgi:hypothetical protein